MRHGSELSTAEDVIAALGGPQGVADITGSKVSAVYMWRRSFPARKYLVMVRALQERGLSAPAALWSQDERPSLTEMAR